MSNYMSLLAPTTFLAYAKTDDEFTADIEELRATLAYDPSTGVFTWLRDQAKKYKCGDVAGCVNTTTGYLQISIYGVLFKAHRLAWLLSFGVWPTHGVDHINGIRLDNRLENLRDVPEIVNNQNQTRAHRDARVGLLGVSVSQRAGGQGFRAQLYSRGARHSLGVFDTPEQAHAAYVTAKRRLHEGCTL